MKGVVSRNLVLSMYTCIFDDLVLPDLLYIRKCVCDVPEYMPEIWHSDSVSYSVINNMICDLHLDWVGDNSRCSFQPEIVLSLYGGKGYVYYNLLIQRLSPTNV